jgi:hypothetical protein
LKYEYWVGRPDGQELGRINCNNVRAFGEYEVCPRIISRGRTIALIDRNPDSRVPRQRIPASSWISRAHYLLDHISCRRFTLTDEPGHAAAWITYIRPSILPFQISYVLELPPGTPEPLRTMTLAACIVVHRTDVIHRTDVKPPSGNVGWGGGGA